MKAVGGKVEDREAFLAALKKVELKDTARGPLSIDRWGNPVQNIYIRKVERVGGKLQNTVDRHHPGRRPVLEVQPRRVHEDAAVQPGLSAVQALLILGGGLRPPSGGRQKHEPTAALSACLPLEQEARASPRSECVRRVDNEMGA